MLSLCLASYSAVTLRLSSELNALPCLVLSLCFCGPSPHLSFRFWVPWTGKQFAFCRTLHQREEHNLMFSPGDGFLLVVVVVFVFTPFFFFLSSLSPLALALFVVSCICLSFFFKNFFLFFFFRPRVCDSLLFYSVSPSFSARLLCDDAPPLPPPPGVS